VVYSSDDGSADEKAKAEHSTEEDRGATRLLLFPCRRVLGREVLGVQVVSFHENELTDDGAEVLASLELLWGLEGVMKGRLAMGFAITAVPLPLF
jgi:hypothetical protein